MNIYIIIGFDSSKVEIQYEEADFLSVEKLYCIGNDEIEETDIIKSVNDKNSLQLYDDLKLEYVDNNVIFIDCRDSVKNYLDIMYSLNTARFENRSYYVCSKKILNLKDYPLISHFNPWTGEKLPKSLTQNERESIMSNYLDLVIILKSYLKSGFDKKKILSLPDGWMMNLANPCLQHITLYYDLKPHAKDVDKNLEFMHNSQFREIVTKTLVHVVSNFIIRNEFVSYGPTRDWFNYNTWNSIEF